VTNYTHSTVSSTYIASNVAKVIAIFWPPLHVSTLNSKRYPVRRNTV